MCVPGAGSGSSSSQPVEIDAESQEDEPQFQIDHIVAEKIEGGRLYYKVKWTGYLESDNTWEPSSGLAHCEDILEDWVCEKQRRARQFETDHAKRYITLKCVMYLRSFFVWPIYATALTCALCVSCVGSAVWLHLLLLLLR